jgi:hypothetical protein
MILLFGTQKSGTTWLRNIVACFTPIRPDAEWYLPRLVSAAENHVSSFCFSPPPLRRKIELQLVRAAFNALLAEAPGCFCDKSAYPSLPESGRNDAEFAYAVDMGRHFFPEAKQVMIVRDPRDVLVSSKYFWPELRNRNMTSFDDEYLQEFIDSWSRCNLTWLSAKPDLVVRYEDLKHDFVAQLTALLRVLDFDVSPKRLKEVQADYETITISRKLNPELCRKGIVGDWRNEITAHQNGVLWNAGAYAMEQFGYTRGGQPSSRKAKPFAGLSVISFYKIMNYNEQVGTVFRTPEGLRCFVFDDGFYLDINVAEFLRAPIDTSAMQIVLLLEIAWDDIDSVNGKWCAPARYGETSSDITRWFMASPRPGKYSRATTAAFGFSIEGVQIDQNCAPIRLMLFNGAQTPITAWIKSMRLGLLPQSSRVSRQLSDLIEAGAPPCEPYNAFFRSVGWTNLHFAANCGNLEIVSRLLEQGVPVDIAEDNGATALHRAVDFNHIEIVEYLLNKGANPNPIDGNLKETPLDIAVRKGHYAVAQLLRNYDAREYEKLWHPALVASSGE